MRVGHDVPSVSACALLHLGQLLMEGRKERIKERRGMWPKKPVNAEDDEMNGTGRSDGRMDGRQ